MDIRKSLEILEVNHQVTMDEAKQAYKDLVNVWHPDRFNESPRLRERAEKKLQEINLAYETLETYLVSKEARKPGLAVPRQGYGEKASGQGAKTHPSQNENRSGGKTEAAFETGTCLVLNAWLRLSQAVRSLVGEVARAAKDPETGRRPPGEDLYRGQGRGNGKGGAGRGAGMPGGRGMGRGKGRGMGPGRGGGRGRQR